MPSLYSAASALELSIADVYHYWYKSAQKKFQVTIGKKQAAKIENEKNEAQPFLTFQEINLSLDKRRRPCARGSRPALNELNVIFCIVVMKNQLQGLKAQIICNFLFFER